MTAAITPTKIVTKNKSPSFSQRIIIGLNAILNCSSVVADIIIKAILPISVPKTNPTMHSRRLSKSTSTKSCIRDAPETLNNANSYLRSFKRLYKAIKILNNIK